MAPFTRSPGTDATSPARFQYTMALSSADTTFGVKSKSGGIDFFSPFDGPAAHKEDRAKRKQKPTTHAFRITWRGAIMIPPESRLKSFSKKPVDSFASGYIILS